MATLNDLITESAKLADIAAHLTELPEPLRVSDVLSLNRPAQRKLFALTDHAPPFTLNQLVSPETIEKEVVFHGAQLNASILAGFKSVFFGRKMAKFLVITCNR